ncbi:MAG: 1-deoxy-D-xylulose-5-phosphate reductoisomerase [Ignavibacteria bacterium]|jgi:1-deoxy-D-xylulose-5-phosphate reductoisomerase
MKHLAILGSTGSIGRNALEVVRNLNKNDYPVKVQYLSAYSNTKLLLEQINEFSPKAVVVFNKSSFEELKKELSRPECELLHGNDGLIELVRRGDYDLMVNALVGFTGLIPTIEALRAGKDIALANKESLVVAGELINNILHSSGSHLFPIDSEHSAILQCLRGETAKSISKLILTASGGPFLNHDKEFFGDITIEEALNHPNWKMGKKITIDSATLMNKGFEIIEGKWLFNIDVEKIEVLIHPQSIVHSMVEFSDGSVKAQLGMPDMKLPIQYAVTYPDRIASDFPKLDLSKLKSLTFFAPDLDKFECLKLAYEVIRLGGSYPVVLNASNEVAVDLFLKKKIKFPGIPYLIRKALEKHDNSAGADLNKIIEIDKWSRDFVRNNAGQTC